MFIKRVTASSRQFGFVDILVGLLPSVIDVGGSIAAAKIQASAAKEITKTQQVTALATGQVQERIAQLQLQALQTPLATGVEISPVKAGIIPSEIAGIPIIYLAFGGIALFLITRRK